MRGVSFSGGRRGRIVEEGGEFGRGREVGAGFGEEEVDFIEGFDGGEKVGREGGL